MHKTAITVVCLYQAQSSVHSAYSLHTAACLQVMPQVHMQSSVALLLLPGYISDSDASSPNSRIAQDVAEQESQTAPSCTYNCFLKAVATASYRCLSIVEVKRL